MHSFGPPRVQYQMNTFRATLLIALVFMMFLIGLATQRPHPARTGRDLFGSEFALFKRSHPRDLVIRKARSGAVVMDNVQVSWLSDDDMKTSSSLLSARDPKMLFCPSILPIGLLPMRYGLRPGTTGLSTPNGEVYYTQFIWGPRGLPIVAPAAVSHGALREVARTLFHVMEHMPTLVAPEHQTFEDLRTERGHSSDLATLLWNLITEENARVVILPSGHKRSELPEFRPAVAWPPVYHGVAEADDYFSHEHMGHHHGDWSGDTIEGKRVHGPVPKEEHEHREKLDTHAVITVHEDNLRSCPKLPEDLRTYDPDRHHSLGQAQLVRNLVSSMLHFSTSSQSHKGLSSRVLHHEQHRADHFMPGEGGDARHAGASRMHVAASHNPAVAATQSHAAGHVAYFLNAVQAYWNLYPEDGPLPGFSSREEFIDADPVMGSLLEDLFGTPVWGGCRDLKSYANCEPDSNDRE